MSGKFKEKLSTVLSIPQELLTDAPKIVFDSNTRVYIENFKSISEYGSECIRISTGKYIIAFFGENLELKTMTSDDLSIEGVIKTVQFS